MVPYCIFTDPPLARVGLSEGEAQTQGIAVRVGHLPMGSVLRSEATDETQGFLKVHVGADDRILGFTMTGSRLVRSWLRCRPRCWPGSRTSDRATRSSRI